MKIGAVWKGVSIHLFIFTCSNWTAEKLVKPEFCGSVDKREK